MMFVRKLAVSAAAALMVLGVMEIGSEIGLPGFYSPVSPAYARLGRPLTPVSVAGVGRRTVRRCAVGVYNC